MRACVRGAERRHRLKAPDIAAVEQMPGVVQVVRDGGFIAVVAEQEWQRGQGAAARCRRARLGARRRALPRRATCARRSAACPPQDMPIFDYPGRRRRADARTLRGALQPAAT